MVSNECVHQRSTERVLDRPELPADTIAEGWRCRLCSAARRRLDEVEDAVLLRAMG